MLACAGAGVALALGTRPRSAPAGFAAAAPWLSAGGLGAAVATTLPELLPLGPVAVYVAVVLAHVVPFWCAGRAGDALLRAGTSRDRSAGFAGTTAGILAAPWLLDLGPHAVSWTCALFLAAGGVAVGPRARLGWRLAALVAVTAAAAGSWEAGGLPRRVSDSGGLLKPILAELVPEGRAGLATTVWNADARIDRLGFGAGELRWTFTNGTAPVAASETPGDAGWWRIRFPLVALPFVVAQPTDVLVVGSTEGVEGEAAARFAGARVQSASYGAGADARRIARSAPASFDLVLLSSCHTTKSARLHANVRDDRLWTREAFGAFRSSLRPGGTLAVLTSDERLFARAVVTAAAGDAPAAQRLWGFRVGGPARTSPYRFLLLADGGSPSAATPERVAAAAAEWPVQPLFGPGVRPGPPWDVLAAGGDADPAEALGRAFSRRAGSWLDLHPASDARPGFFAIAREAHPYPRWLVATCLVPLLVVLLGPLGAERRRDATEPGVPVAAGLAELALLGGGLALLVAAIVTRTPFVTGVALGREPAALAGLAAGFGVAWVRLARSRADTGALAVPLAAAAVVAVVAGLGEAAVGAAARSAVVRQIVGAGLGAGLGAAAAASLAAARRRLDEGHPGAGAWGWVAYGIAVAGGAPLAAWIAHVRDWPTVAVIVVAAHLGSVAVAAWSRVSPRRPVRADG